MVPDNNLDVVVIVSGQEVPIKINVHQTFEHLVHEALSMSNNKGQPVSNWELKTIDGVTLTLTEGVGSANLTDGAKLFLNPKVGAGG